MHPSLTNTALTCLCHISAHNKVVDNAPRHGQFANHSTNFPAFVTSLTCDLHVSILSVLGNIGEISHPMTLTTYVAVADFMSPDGVTPVFSFKKGSLLQVIQKDPSGGGDDIYVTILHGVKETKLFHMQLK